MSLRSDRKAFLNPPREPAPLLSWRWNDAPDGDVIAEQLDAIARAGFGGVIVAPALGLPAEKYDSKDWYGALTVAAKRAKKRGLTLWLQHDFAPARYMRRAQPELDAQHWLKPEVLQIGQVHRGLVLPGEAVAAFVETATDPNHGRRLRSDGSGYLMADRTAWAPVLFETAAEALHGRRVLRFREETDHSRYNLLSAASVKALLENELHRHYQNLRRSFGNVVTHVCAVNTELATPPGALPWDPELATLFRDTRGYDLLPYLPALFFDQEDSAQIRFDYWTLVAEMFREGFAATVQRWCNNRKASYTGHIGFQPSLREKVRQTGASMPFYEYQDVPAVHVPGRPVYASRFDLDLYLQHVVALKEATSASAQLGKADCASTLLDGAGPGLPPEELYGAALFHLLLGVTRPMMNGAVLSVRGDRKVDTPPGLDPRQPYWQQVNGVINALARLGWLLRQGQQTAEVLLLHPSSSLQAAYRHARNDAEAARNGSILSADLPAEAVEKHFALLTSELLDNLIAFDYGDEVLLQRLGRVDRKTLHVGAQQYATVVIPPLLNIRSRTVELLQDFATGGGRIIAVGTPPRLVDGRPSEKAVTLLSQYAHPVSGAVPFFDYRTVAAAIRERIRPAVQVRQESGTPITGLKLMRRRWGDREIVALANVSLAKVSGRLTFPLPEGASIETWDVMTGESHALSVKPDKHQLSLAADWAPLETRVWVTLPADAKPPAPAFVPRPRSISKVMAPEWLGRPRAQNVLRLDKCEVLEEGTGKLLSPAHVRRVLYKRIQGRRRPVRITTRWPFEVSPIIPWTEACQVVVELAEETEVRLNGEDLYPGVAERMDGGEIAVNLPRLALGANHLVVTATYRSAWDFEAPWVRGDFRVNTDNGRDFYVEFDTGPIGTGAWHNSGLPFYYGTVNYRAEVEGRALTGGERVYLEMPGLRGSAHVLVDGSVAGDVLLPPYRCELTALWKEKRMLVEVTAANSLRNFIGPHFARKDFPPVGHTRSDYEGTARQSRRFEACGLIEPPKIVFRR